MRKVQLPQSLIVREAGSNPERSLASPGLAVMRECAAPFDPEGLPLGLTGLLPITRIVKNPSTLSTVVRGDHLPEDSSVKLVVYDFDQTISVEHLFYKLKQLGGGGFGKTQEEALSEISDEELLHIFGGADRVKELHQHFSTLEKHQIEIAIISFGKTGVIKTALERMNLFHQHFAKSVIIGSNSEELLDAGRCKAKCIMDVFRSRLTSEQIIFVDDDPRNIERARADRVCHTVLVVPQEGMDQKHMKQIQQMAGIADDADEASAMP